MHILFIFLDGVGLGEDDPTNNPFAAAKTPTLNHLAGGISWTARRDLHASDGFVFVPTDACLGVEGKPQSATGQATILTGLNVPKQIGYHYGPKPDANVREVIRKHSIIGKLASKGIGTRFLNAFPAGFFKVVNSGKRLLSANQLAMQAGNVPLPGTEELIAGNALSADFTGLGWHKELGITNVPVLTPQEAGRRMAALARQQPLSFFDHWVTDYVGHRGTLEEAVRLLEVFDGVMEGLLEEWRNADGLVLITSDHGNIEDIRARGHTTNPVPTVVFGDSAQDFADGLTDLTHIGPKIVEYLAKRY